MSVIRSIVAIFPSIQIQENKLPPDALGDVPSVCQEAGRNLENVIKKLTNCLTDGDETIKLWAVIFGKDGCE